MLIIQWLWCVGKSAEDELDDGEGGDTEDEADDRVEDGAFGGGDFVCVASGGGVSDAADDD